MKAGKCLNWIFKIKAVEKEYQVAVIARDVLGAEMKKRPALLTKEGLQNLHFDDFSENLNSTYLVRMFTEFESGLRDFWKIHLKKKSVAKASVLIKSIGSHRKIYDQQIEDVDKVREYRNTLIHDSDSGSEVVEIGAARRSLCIYYSRLPEDW